MNPFSEWLTEVAGDSLLVDDTEGGLEREARNNLWSFSISQDQALALTAPDVTDFLEAVIEARRQQIMRMNDGRQPMAFYCWCDEPVRQMRFSLVSTSHGRLPFDLHVEESEDINSVAGRFLAFPNHEGLPLSEFERQPLRTDLTASAAAPAPLLVWTKRLP